MTSIRTSIFQRYRAGAIALLLGVLVSVAVAWQIDSANNTEMNAAVARVLDYANNKVDEDFTLYQYGLRGMRGAVLTAGESLSRKTVRTYAHTRNLPEEFPGALGFGFIRRVQQQTQASFVTKARADGWPQFDIHEIAPNPDERFVIQYIEPVARNVQALGLDIASEPRRKEAALRAMRSGKTQLTAPITLVQATGKPTHAFLMLLPVYASPEEPATPEEREASAIGWVYAPLIMDEIIASSPIDSTRFRLDITDITNDAKNVEPFYTNVAASPTKFTLFPHALEREMFGRKWRIEVAAGPAFVQASPHNSPSRIFATGSLISFLLAGLIFAGTVSGQRQHEFNAQRERLATIVSGTADAIVGQTTEGVVTDWNPGAERLFGYTQDETIGRHLVDLIIPTDLKAEEACLLRRVINKQDVHQSATLRRGKDGRTVHVSVTMSPILDAHGRVIGASCILRDISEQMRNEARIRDLNANLEAQVQERTAELRRLNMLFGSVLGAATRVSIIATDKEGVITLFNTGAERLLGYTAAEILQGETPARFHLEAEVIARTEELSAEYGTVISGFRVFVHKPELDGAEVREWTYVRKDGSHVPVSLAVTPISDEDGAVTGYLCIAKDISERKAAEDRLATSLATTQAILDTALNPVFTVNGQGQVCSLNSAGERLFGVAASEIVGRPLNKLLKDPSPENVAQLLARCWLDDTDSHSTHALEVLAQRGDGSTFPAQLSLGGQSTAGIRLAVGVLTDLSLAHKQRADLSAAHDQLQLASEVAELGVWTWVLADNSLQWNERMFELYDWPSVLQEHGVTYHHWRSRVHPGDIAATEARLVAAVEGRQQYDCVFRIIRNNGEVRFLQAAAQVERDADGRALKVTGINRDITTQRELEARLQGAKEHADAASAAKSTFLANMSHEIRTPMNAVLGMLQLVEQTELNARQHDYITKARGAATALLGLLNDILDYSKIEAGKLQIDAHRFALEDLLSNLAIVLSGNQGSKDLEVIFDIDPDLPRELLGDSLRIRQVLINLAGNALKFTPRGAVRVQVQALQRTEEAVQVRFGVHDTGIGISTEQQGRIFEAFTQAEASTTRRFGGTGLGLVISERLVRLMDGRLRLESAPGAGSRFWFDIWLPVADPGPILQAQSPTDRPLHVLVVEDNALVAKAMVQTINALGWQAEHASSGTAAVAAVRNALAQGQRYDVVLMDWKMPDLDGLSAARLIRQSSPRTADLPCVIMLTAHDREMLSENAGDPETPFVDFLTKPVTPQQLLSTIRKALGAQVTTRDADPKRRDQRLAGLQLLIVEDNALNRQIATELLAGEGALVTVAEGGKQGVAQVLSAVQQFDAVLMDMQMPDIDGLEATRRIRADGRFKTLPIIAMTANASHTDRQACLAAGMDDHVAKPIDLASLVATLLQYTGRAMPPSRHSEPSEQGNGLIEPLPSILLRFGENVRLYRDMQHKFLPDQRKLLDELAVNISKSDAKAARRVVHTIKGNAGTMGARALSMRAADLESRLTTGDEVDIQKLLPAVVVTELEHLLLESSRLLQAALDATSPPKQPAGNTGWDLQQWRDGLLALQPLLETGNMRALEMTENLPTRDHRSCASDIEKLLAQVQALDFPAASLTVRSLLEAL